MPSPKPIRVAMLVVDANDVRGSSMKNRSRPSPVVHPAIEALWEGLRERQDCTVQVLFGRLDPAGSVRPEEGALSFHPVPYRRLGGFFPGAGFLGRGRSLMRALRDFRPDVVHGQGSERESALVAAYAPFPSVLTLHGLMEEVARMPGNRLLFHYRVAGWLERLAVRKSHGVIAISPYALRVTLNHNSRCRFIPNAVRSVFYQTHLQRVVSAKPRVLFVGNLTAVKRPEWFLRAVRQLWARGLDFEATMLVMGNPRHPYYREILQQAEETPWGRRIEVRANVERVWEEMARADILFAPSTWESMGIAVCEAMAAGLCVVASRIEANIPLLGQGCGAMFATGSWEEAVQTLEKVIRHRKLREEAVQLGQKRVAEYHPTRVAEQTVNFYRAIRDAACLGGTRGPG